MMYGHRFKSRPVISGVFQDCKLGSLLFLIYIKDLPLLLQYSCRLFADDALLYDTSNNSNILQNHLSGLEAWTKQWKMTFNTPLNVHFNLKVVNSSY